MHQVFEITFAPFYFLLQKVRLNAPENILAWSPKPFMLMHARLASTLTHIGQRQWLHHFDTSGS